jgi:hypothetical protein
MPDFIVGMFDRFYLGHSWRLIAAFVARRKQKGIRDNKEPVEAFLAFLFPSY